MKKSVELSQPAGEFLYGFKPIEEAVRLYGFWQGDVLYVARRQSDLRLRNLLTKARKAGCRVQQESYQKLTQLIQHNKHQGIVLHRLQKIPFLELLREEIEMAKQFCVYLALDGLEDPRNLGAIARTAVGLGCKGLILAKQGNAPLGATALKTSAGALLYLPILYVPGLPSFLQQLKEKNEQIFILGASGKASLLSAQLAGQLKKEQRPVILLLGGEQGLSKLVQERCDLLVSLPMSHTLESYNVSVAAAMFLYEFLGREQLAKS